MPSNPYSSQPPPSPIDIATPPRRSPPSDLFSLPQRGNFAAPSSTTVPPKSVSPNPRALLLPIHTGSSPWAAGPTSTSPSVASFNNVPWSRQNQASPSPTFLSPADLPPLPVSPSREYFSSPSSNVQEISASPARNYSRPLSQASSMNHSSSNGSGNSYHPGSHHSYSHVNSESSTAVASPAQTSFANSMSTTPYSSKRSSRIPPPSPGSFIMPLDDPVDKFEMSPDPSLWGAHYDADEKDDELHNPDPKRDRMLDTDSSIFTWRGFMNLGCLFVLAVFLMCLFAGYPIFVQFTRKPLSTMGAYNIGGTNSTGQTPVIPNRSLIDKDTPQSEYVRKGYKGQNMNLVFSDEFNTEGRSFWPGDDPFWEAENIHYWGTNNLEWSDPKAFTTEGGDLVITMAPDDNHNLNMTGGYMSTWNKFCFTGGAMVAKVQLPGSSTVPGAWPGIWTLGNLGRLAYGATLEGLWPYSYDTCDVGTVANQSVNGIPEAATNTGEDFWGGPLSFLVGQRLSRCTCAGEDHPGPKHPDGSFVGRAAPEIDLLEALVDPVALTGHMSCTFQVAPFDDHYHWHNTTGNFEIYGDGVVLNEYTGGVIQQAVSGLVPTVQECYQYSSSPCYAEYAFEYKPGTTKDSYITWFTDGDPSWSVYGSGLAPNDVVQIGERPIPEEPMYIILDLAISNNFGKIDWEGLAPQWPLKMRIDWIRVYQDEDSINVTCDPEDYPTRAYIEKHWDLYTNPNLTTMAQANMTMPKNSFLGQC